MSKKEHKPYLDLILYSLYHFADYFGSYYYFFDSLLTLLVNFLTSFFKDIISDIKNKSEIAIRDINNIKLVFIFLYYPFHINHNLKELEIKIK